MHAPEFNRRLENLLMLGTVDSVDLSAARCRVKAGGLLTAAIPWLTLRAGNARTWWAPTIGEQVLLLSPGGDPSRGVALPALYSDAHPAPGNTDKLDLALYDDGAVISYDAVAHVLAATLPAGGKVQVAAPGGVEVTGDVTITGKLRTTDKATFDADVHCAQTVTADTDVKGGGISLKNHVHKGVTSGTSVSGKPQ